MCPAILCEMCAVNPNGNVTFHNDYRHLKQVMSHNDLFENYKLLNVLACLVLLRGGDSNTL